MADKAISELDTLATPADGDWLAIVDISPEPDVTKKITFANLLQNYFDKNVDDTADITEAVDYNFVTDAELVVLGNTSGSNTGDQTIPVKATASDIDTGTDDAKFATSKAIEDSDLSFVSDFESLQNKKYRLNDTPAENDFAGTCIRLYADVDLTLGLVCYVKNDGDMAKADASVIATSSAIGITTSFMFEGDPGTFLLSGIIHLHTLAPGWTIGGLVYLSTTAGGMTQTAPSATDEVIQILGVALASDIMYFNPQLVQVEHT